MQIYHNFFMVLKTKDMLEYQRF